MIDVHGRKVVRVNDVELFSNPINSHIIFDVLAVDVGARAEQSGVSPRDSSRPSRFAPC